MLLLSSIATATVRVGIKDGRRFIYNDGVGSSPHETLRRSGPWLATRVAIPSLYDSLIERAAGSASVDPRLVKSVMLIESAFNPAAISRKGARGLMQLMPETAASTESATSSIPRRTSPGERATSRICSGSTTATSESRSRPTTPAKRLSRGTEASLLTTRRAST